MPAPLPFSDFLLLLRRRGYDVGIEQHKDVARLCEALGAEAARDRRLMSRSLAALLSRSQKESAAIEALFFEHYALALKDDEELTRTQPEAIHRGLLREEVANLQGPRPRRWKPALFAVLALLLLLGIGVFRRRNLTHSTTTAVSVQPAPSMLRKGEQGQNDGPKQTVGLQLVPPIPPLAEPELGPKIERFRWRRAAAVALSGPVVLFMLLYAVTRRRRMRSWAKEYWREVRDELGGAEEVSINFNKLLPPALARGDLEDMATILGRSDDRASSRALDGERTVRATLAKGALPQLVYKRQPAARTVIVLCDVSSDMRPWKRRSEALIDGLRRRSVPLVVRYFDGQAERVSEKPFGPQQPLAQVQRLYPDAALLMISVGVGATAHDRDDLLRPAPWLAVCKKYRLRVWLNPVLNRKLWRQSLRRRDFPMRVLPMSRKGLLAAAYELAQEPERRRHIAHAAASPERAATGTDKLRLQQLLTLWPDAPLELGAYLLYKFCPGAPEETLLRVLAMSREASGQRFRFTEAEMSRWLTELQDSEKHLQSDAQIQQRLEERVRRDLLRILRQHEPADRRGAEHLQWRLQCAMQQLYLHDVDDHNAKAALATLAELAQGPLWEDVAAAMAMLDLPLNRQPRGKPTRSLAAPVKEKLQAQVLGLIRATAGGKVQVPAKSAGAAQQIGGLSLPGLLHWPARWELVLTLLVLLLCVFGVYQKRIGREVLAHVEAYQIERTGSLGTLQADLRVIAKGNNAPRIVRLCPDAKCSEPGPELQLTTDSAQRSVKREKENRLYHVRARLPSGVWAYSKQVLVPALSSNKPPATGKNVAEVVQKVEVDDKEPVVTTDARESASSGKSSGKPPTGTAGPVVKPIFLTKQLGTKACREPTPEEVENEYLRISFEQRSQLSTPNLDSLVNIDSQKKAGSSSASHVNNTLSNDRSAAAHKQDPNAMPSRQEIVARLKAARCRARATPSTPEVVPGTAEVRGSLDNELIRRVIRWHQNEVNYCYEVENRKHTTAITGRVIIQFTIAGNGSVLASVVQSSTVINPALEQCVSNAVRRWEFPKPQGGGIVVVSYPFGFPVENQDEKTEVRFEDFYDRPEYLLQGEKRKAENSERGVIKIILEGVNTEVQHCLTAAEKTKKSARSETVKVRFMINESGSVDQAELVSSTISKREVSDCVLQTLRRRKFPVPAAPPAQVSFSFVLN